MYGIYSDRNFVWYRGIVLGFRTWGKKSLALTFENEESAIRHMNENGLIGTAKKIEEND